jgi:predicted AlkP superfamily pyrophosphatase or phosphodiesterase
MLSYALEFETVTAGRVFVLRKITAGFLCGLLWWMTGASVWAQKKNAAPKRTRLVLLLTVDQFRYDYLERFKGLYQSGVARLMRGGASWANANYDHTPTYTAPGHATLMTGAWPAETGIIGNEWPDFDEKGSVSSVSDAKTKLLGGEPDAKGSSPRRLMASTVGDELRLASDSRAKVIGISVKDRAAILPAGRHANAAYWFSDKTGTFVSSDYYFQELPAWAADFNAAAPAKKYCGQTWNRLLPEAEYARRAGPDAPFWEMGKKNNAPLPTDADKQKAVSFPHTLPEDTAKCYKEVDYTPFSNDLMVAMAQAAIIKEGLGADDDADVLSVSFSANDYVGHRYGPYSQEAMDISLRVDRSIGALLDFVDKKVGLAQTLVIFTADHGVAPTPEHAAELGLPGGRIPEKDILNSVKKEFTARFKKGGEAAEDNTADYIDKLKGRDVFANGNLYLNQASLKRDGVEADEAEEAACVAALRVAGIARCFTRTQLERGAISPQDPLARRVLHGFYPRRSGDVIVVYEAFKYLGDGSAIATHGSPYSYDTHVPLILMGGAFKPGRYAEAATPADIAPTLAHVLGAETPSNSVGRVLREGLK